MAKENTPSHLLRNQKGFTLVELLIVVIILAVLAAIVVPQFGSSTEDANISTLKANLASLRSTVEVYYQQHNSRYPGAFLASDGTTASADGTCPAAFLDQLTLYTDKNGKTSGLKTAVFKYGPYVKDDTLPTNPFLDGAAASAILCDTAAFNLDTDSVSVGATATGWKFYTQVGRLIPNDKVTLTDGSNTLGF